jgi:hypothetical protein
MIPFEGRITRAMYARALRRQMRKLHVIAVLWIAVAAMSLMTAPPSDSPARWGIPLLFALAGIFLLLSPELTARRAFRTGKLLAAPFRGFADEERIVIETQFGRNEIPWSVYFRATSTPDMIFLFTSAQQSQLLHRAFFASGAEWEQFADIVRRHVPTRRSGRATVPSPPPAR